MKNGSNMEWEMGRILVQVESSPIVTKETASAGWILNFSIAEIYFVCESEY